MQESYVSLYIREKKQSLTKNTISFGRIERFRLRKKNKKHLKNRKTCDDQTRVN
jgi:hypothetical protein